MGFVLSCATTPKRIHNLLCIIPQLKLNYKYFVINICEEYKRFGKFKIPKALLKLSKQNKRVVFQFVDDFGPVCKYIGGFQFMKKKNLKDDKLIIIDDDTFYHKDLFYELMDEKTTTNITTGSGFNYGENGNYQIVYGSTQMVEGYGGICFDYDQCSDFINWYVGFYKCIAGGGDAIGDLLDKYLMASFLGDDFILSNVYTEKSAIKGGRQYIRPCDYGFNADALHKNNVFGSNMGSYSFLKENIIILETFKLKYLLNQSINEVRTIS